MTIMAYLCAKETYPNYTWSELAAEMAAKRMGVKLDFKPVKPVDRVAEMLVAGSAQFGTLPHYNLEDGLVQKGLDLIYEHNLRIVGAERVPIVWAAGIHPQDRRRSVVFSHPKALAQCSGWIKRECPDASQVETLSTADAPEKVKEFGRGVAISRREALAGLEIIAEGIGNDTGNIPNFTDCYIVTANGEVIPYEDGKDYRTLIVMDPHVDREGLLWEMLGVIKDYGINNTDIHSRPSRNRLRLRNGGGNKSGEPPKMFYLEMAGHQDDRWFKECVGKIVERLNPLNEDVEVVRVLGSYEAPKLPE